MEHQQAEFLLLMAVFVLTKKGMKMSMGLTLEELLQPTMKPLPKAKKELTEAQRIANEKFRKSFFAGYAWFAELMKTRN